MFNNASKQKASASFCSVEYTILTQHEKTRTCRNCGTGCKDQRRTRGSTEYLNTRFQKRESWRVCKKSEYLKDKSAAFKDEKYPRVKNLWQKVTVSKARLQRTCQPSLRRWGLPRKDAMRRDAACCPSLQRLAAKMEKKNVIFTRPRPWLHLTWTEIFWHPLSVGSEQLFLVDLKLKWGQKKGKNNVWTQSSWWIHRVHPAFYIYWCNKSYCAHHIFAEGLYVSTTLAFKMT